MSGTTWIPTPFSYSAAVMSGGTAYLGLHRGFGADFASQLDGAVAGVSDTLAKLGLTLADLIKVSVWLRDIQDLPAMEHQFTQYFETDRFPARMTATTEFFDADCLVMIEGIARAADQRDRAHQIDP